MVDVPTNARVTCADRSGGRCTGVLVDQMTWTVTHLIVREDRFPYTEVLVPADWVVETTPDRVRLRCTRRQLAAMQPFYETQYTESSRSAFVGDPYSGWYGWPFVAPVNALVPQKRERVRAGEFAVRQGARVQATDGQVGQVDEFIADPASRQITHLVLREGPLWGQKDVTVPITEVDRTRKDVVYLKLDRSAVRSLPTVPVREWHNRPAR